jgi:hypothetical protein
MWPAADYYSISANTKYISGTVNSGIYYFISSFNINKYINGYSAVLTDGRSLRVSEVTPKTRNIDFGKSIINIEERKKVVAVATTKLVEVHTAYPSTESKLQLTRMLSDVSGLPQDVLFDRVSHKGYINRYLDNLRCKMSPSKHRYTWKKKLQVDQSVVVTLGTSSLASNGVQTLNNG